MAASRTDTALAALLRRLSDGRFHSGAALALSLGVSRAAVWKYVEKLRQQQVEVQAVAGRGYRLPAEVELLDADRIGETWREIGYTGVLAVEVRLLCASTNAILMERARAAAVPQVLLAETQSGGRGRWGRSWQSPFGGGLYLSLLWPFPLVPAGLTGLSLACAVSIADVLRRQGARQVGLKWPNDIVSSSGKLGGILVELFGEPAGPCSAVIGVGLNLRLGAGPREAIGQPAADLQQFIGDAALRRNALAAHIVAGLARCCAGFPDTGLAPYQGRWAGYDLLAGERVVLQLPQGPVEGVARGIDARGALCLETAAGEESYFSGDLQLRLRRDTTD